VSLYVCVLNVCVYSISLHVSYQSLLCDLGGPNFIADDVRLAVGVHSLDITISTEFGQVLRVPPLEIMIPG
jgi:hypothetical protein